MLSVIITGAGGRMGRTLVCRANQTAGVCLGGATEHPQSNLIGQDACAVAGCGTKGIAIEASLEAVLTRQTSKQALIDFTSPQASMNHVALAIKAGCPLVLGTTGFEPPQLKTIEQAAKQIPIVMAPNMSVGVNTLFYLVESAARILSQDFDMEIFEAHHKLKKDAPSGTATKLAEILAAVAHRRYPEDITCHREGLVGERPQREIGMQVMRGGDIVGEHTVFFCGMGERVELTHRATSRHVFADGAIRAALWVVQQKPGLYDMRHVLGIAK